MAVEVTITRGFKDPNYFDDLNPSQSYIYSGSGAGAPGTVVGHNALTGLQGDGPANQYYHLNENQFTSLRPLVDQLVVSSALDWVHSIETDDLILHGEIYFENAGESSGGHDQRFIYWGESGDVDTYIYEHIDDELRAVCGSQLVMVLDPSGITLGAGVTVDTIEDTLTDDVTHVPTSSAVYDAIAVGVGGKLDTSDRTIYIETTGDDDTGDGSIGDPFATILRALQDIGSILDPAVITVNLGIGTFQYDDDCIVEFGRLKFFGARARLYFQGTTDTVESGLTLTEQAGKEWRYDVSGATFTADEHNENFLVIEDSISSDIFPIMGNGTTTIDSFTGVEDATEIVTLQTIIEFTALIFSPDVVGGRFRIKNIDCDATIGLINYRVDNIHTVLRECILRIDSITAGYLYDGPGFLINNTLVLTDNEDGYAIKNYGQLTINKGGLRHNGSGSGFIAYGVLETLGTSSHSLFIQNYVWGIEVRKQSKFAGNDLTGGNGCIVFNDVTYAFGCSNNSIIHVGSETVTSPEWMRMYIEDVDYVLHSREGSPSHGINVLINPLYGTPDTAYLHSIFDDFVDAMPSFNHNIIIDGYNLYESTYNATETSARTIYVAAAGDDVDGNGEVGTPYATLLRALQDVRNIIDDVVITISLGVGTFTYNGTAIQHELLKKEILGEGALLIEGTPVLKDSGFTLAASGDPYIYNVSGTTFTSNEHQDRFLLVGSNYYGIMSNGTTTINAQIGLAAGISIYGMDTILQCTDGIFDISVKNTNPAAQVSFEQLTIDASSYTLNPSTGNIDLKFFDCLIEATDIFIDQQVLKVLFNRTHIVVSSDGIDDNSRIPNAIGYKSLTLRKSGATAGTGIAAPSNMLFQTTYIANFEYGVALRAGLVTGDQADSNLIFEDCTYAINVLNRSQLVCTLLAVYIENVDYTFSGDGETIAFGTKVYIENFTGTPNTATFDASVDEASTDSSIDVYWLPFAPGSGASYWDRSSAGVISPDTVGDTLSIDAINEEASGVGVNIEGVLLRDSFFVLTEVATPGTPAANTGYLYMDDGDEHIYFKTSSVTYDLTEVGGSGGLSWSGSTANGIGTYIDVDTIQAEANLTFDGSVLTLAGTLSINDTNTQIWEDGSSNLTFKDAVTGTKTLAQLSTGGVTPAALTKVNDTNVTLTLGGTPATALLQATSLTLGWTGTLADGRIASAAAWNAKSDMAWTNGGGNRIGTYVDADTINAEANLTFDGSILTVNGDIDCPRFTTESYGIRMIGNDTGDTNLSYLGLYASDGTTRQAYIGIANSGNDDLYIHAQTGDLLLQSATGAIRMTGAIVATELMSFSVTEGTIANWDFANTSGTGVSRITLSTNSGAVKWYVQIEQDGDGYFADETDNHIMNWDNDRRVSAGRYTSIDAESSFTAFNSAAAEFGATVWNSNTGTTSYGLKIKCGATTQSSNLYVYLSAQNQGGSEEGGLRNNAGTFEVYQGSDIRLKTNIVDTKINTIEILTSLQIRDFNRVGKDHTLSPKQTGWIAQEVEKVYPAMHGYNEGTDLHTIAPSALIPVLHRGWQLHEERLETQEDKIIRLEKRVEELEAQIN